MRQIFYIDTEVIFERACQLRGFDAKPDDRFYESKSSERMVNSWLDWYNVNVEQTHVTAGEVEQAVWEALEIPAPARHGFGVSFVDKNSIIITDLEEMDTCDLNDPADEHMVLPVTQFREWLYKWNGEALNRVMDTQEAAAIWGYASADVVKRLCREGKVKCRKLTNGSYIIDRNQPSPKMGR
jgi:hypothetical protein